MPDLKECPFVCCQARGNCCGCCGRAPVIDRETLAQALAREFGCGKWDSLVPLGFEIYDGMGCQSFWMKIATATAEHIRSRRCVTKPA